ncbi:MAG: 4Fe-4S binding protein [Methanofollis liminatans]|jgi:formate hydrogenlyase subunit 6/NADH:ubiquinone oxidoreductase subunit I|uniref:4Fe-4S ferredoxin iron-sulfur binding domain-containing protein n=1 Tax=Methanofollis liminatans DSM 4140 TaxID=28892 RepID=J1L2M3_9EURY|nr:4Fe-4S binding protein [Methanofollis liminatans]EJG06920.1 4Fe-4S ferredoxin iron-sulfur binding domain-containing protein [Methanofollis liminatans DSM 4140]MDD3112409.1 4Fe-4S binding protein [Methanofollis liminatans]
MAGLPMIPEVLRQMFKTPATNAFPAKYLPRSVTAFLARVAEGKAEIHPPVAVPPAFRGKILYDREACIGCKICINICPAHAIEFLPGTKKVRIYVTQCCFCSQCNDACPKDALHMSTEFLLADEDRYSDNLIVE